MRGFLLPVDIPGYGVADSEFITAFNFGNDAFSASAAEDFVLSKTGVTGTYSAIEIDDLTISTAVSPGGTRGENTVNLFIYKTVRIASQVVEGSILTVRGKRVRVNSINDDADNTVMLGCGSVGVKL